MPAPQQSAKSEKEIKEKEKARSEELKAASAHVVYDAIKMEGEAELKRPTVDLAYSGLAAGLSMGFSFATEALLRNRLPDASWRPLISKLGYAVGFLIVILGRQQLFTENTLTPVIPLLDKKSPVTVGDVMRLWITVLIANVAGAAAFALVAASTIAFDTDVRVVMHAISTEAFHQGQFLPILVKAVYAGWLIAMVVWLMPAAEGARVWVIIILTYIIGIAGFPHIIAGSTEVLYSVFDGSLSAGRAIGNYMLPTLIGNIIGGVALVAALNYAQVAAGDEEK